MISESLRPYPDIFETSSGFVIHSPAKVNLSLRVLGKRDDGFHELDTLFQELDWFDEISFSKSNSFEFSVSGADLAADDSNLVVRAAKALSTESGKSLGGRIHLEKRIPLKGGLGGGSSNGSVALLGLNRLWGLDWPVSRLQPIAASLGADCPFFLYGGMARGTGRGDEIRPLEGALNGTVVTVVPGFGLSTAAVFGEMSARLTEVEKNVIFTPLPIAGEGGFHPQLPARNDLENIVFRSHVVLRDYRDTLLELGASIALMSGSGSTLFGVFASDETALLAAQRLTSEPDLRVKVCRAVARHR